MKKIKIDPNSVNFMRGAIDLATKNVITGKGGPFGARIFKNGKLIAEGANSVTTDLDPTAHAEINAIRNACRELNTFNLEGCELYTSCEPCPMCLASAYWAHVDVIYYGCSAADAAEIGFDDAFIYNEFRKPVSIRTIPAKQLLREEAKISFQEWSKSQEKIAY